ncbi:MAG: hypothetical protein O7D86_13270 [Proteobacteria bacterium]|nr:hypothetical protein [Pseudomonadota bacterium]
MKKTKPKKGGAEKPISLHEVSFEQALKGLLNTKIDKDEPRKKPRKKV